MNKLIVIGNLGRAPEMQYTSSGQSVTKFSVASNRKYTTGAGSSERKPSGSIARRGASWPRRATST